MKALALAALIALAPGAAAMTDTTETRNKAIVADSFSAWAAGTGSPFDLLADDARWTIVGASDASGTYAGKAEFIEKVIAPFNRRLSSGIRPVVRNIYADGDTVIVFFDAAGTARDGKPYENTYTWYMELKDGCVVRVHAFFDSVIFNDLWRRIAAD